MRPIPRSLAALALTLAPVAASAADWPWWRGPLGTGVSPETALPTTWSREEGVAWTVALAGAGV